MMACRLNKTFARLAKRSAKQRFLPLIRRILKEPSATVGPQ
jgi:hypothetical protein